MSKPKSVYLTDRSMSALRPGDSLSARMNQIVDRYLQVLAAYQVGLREEFDHDEWELLLDLYAANKPQGDLGLSTVWAEIIDQLAPESSMRQYIDAMPIAELLGLMELLEADLAKAPATHS